MSAPSSDRVAIEQFLVQAGGEAIHLVAIPAEGGPVQGRWFGVDAAGAGDWAAQRNGSGANIYWSPNPPRAGLNKKARKDDIETVRYAHVDIDPPKRGGELDKGAAVAKLRAARLPPSLIVDSGGGVQALWRLDSPAAADAASIECIENTNRSLIERFGGDPVCWNVDRVLRVPGTVNLPNAKKRAAGRVPVAAMLLTATDDSTSMARLIEGYGATPLPERAVATPVASPAGGIATLNALGIGPADPLLKLLTDPIGDDRSADTYAAACDMLRGGHSDDNIAVALLDPELPISAHCLAQADPDRAAARAIAKARAEVASEASAFNALGAGGLISATPYGWPAAYSIPPRRWLYGRQLLRGTIAVVVAPGATGKSALTVGIALALSTGRPLLGKEVPGGPKRVWLYNLEDAREELDRSIVAAAWHHGISRDDVGDRLFVNSGLSGAGLCSAVTTRQGFTIVQPVFDALVAEIMARQIDCLIVDPFVSSHQVSENDNGAIDAVAKAWAKVAAATDCAILLVHHTSKAAGQEVTVDRSRGASALTNAARSVTVLNRMTPEEAQRLGIEPGEERRYVRCYDDKNNRAPPAEASDWFYLESVDLPNGEGDEFIGDSVGVAILWLPPLVSVAEPLAPNLAAEVQQLIAQGEWRENERTESWAGKAIAQVLGLDANDKVQRVRIKTVLKALLADDTLRQEARRDGHREMRTWIVIGSTPAQHADFASGPEEGAAAVTAALRQSTAALRQGTDELPRRSGTPFRESTTTARHGAPTARVGKDDVAKNYELAKTAALAAGQSSSAGDADDGSEFLRALPGKQIGSSRRSRRSAMTSLCSNPWTHRPRCWTLRTSLVPPG